MNTHLKRGVVLREKKEHSSHDVLRYVIEMVISGRIQPTEVLYETSVAADTGLSRTPVREALARLVNEGFLEQTKGKRGYAVPSLTLDDMRNVYHARECIEQKIAYLAAEKAVKADIDVLQAINAEEVSDPAPANGSSKQVYTRRGESYSAVDANVRLHLTVAHIARNKYLERLYEMTYWRSHLYTHYIISRRTLSAEVERIFQKRRNKNRAAEEHAELIQAIAMRDGDLATKLTLEHLHSTTYYAIAFLYPDPLYFGNAS